MTIDLSRFLGKKVRVTLRDGSEREVEIFKSIWHVCGNETFCLYDKPGSPIYNSAGQYLSDPKPGSDIICIKELTMSNYEELEKKVAEMQAEIDRLKAQERKVRTFREDIQQFLRKFHSSAAFDYEEFISAHTEKVCEIVRSYLPELIENPNVYYDTGYNDALTTVGRNLGLVK